jgi:hypothetical protein
MTEAKVYIVLLQRMDLPEPLEIMVTEVEKEAIAKLQSLDEMWVNAVEKRHPYRIDVPYKGSFAPNLVKEIRIEEMTVSEFQHLNNPHSKNLKATGVASWMGQNFNNGNR